MANISESIIHTSIFYANYFNSMPIILLQIRKGGLSTEMILEKIKDFGEAKRA
ncbi:hypothetical protein [Lactobacillus helveticus]|nr:hypothetical protein [Lactobacillus helveticus]MCJ2190361.1 hypothetical protein [Lactobacillus helveticus]